MSDKNLSNPSALRQASTLIKLALEQPKLENLVNQTKTESSCKKLCLSQSSNHISSYKSSGIVQNGSNSPGVSNDDSSMSDIESESDENLTSLNSPLTANSPLPSSEDGNIMISMFSQVFEYLERIQDDLKSLKAEQRKMQFQLSRVLNEKSSLKTEQMTKPFRFSEVLSQKEPIHRQFSLPDGIVLPVETDVQLCQLNLRLREDESLTPALTQYLYSYSSGKSIPKFMLSVCRRVLSRSVATLYSRLGRKGKKSFETVEEIYQAILTATAQKFPDASKEDLADRFGRILASAHEWEGNHRKKKRNIQYKNTKRVKQEFS